MAKRKFELANPVIVGLDVDTIDEARRLVRLLGSRAGAYKVGPRLIVRHGQDLISEIAKAAPVFVDNKYFDIPSTMVAAVQASFDAGATLATVHGIAGREALGQLALLEEKLNQIRPFQILAVTVLTSFSVETLPQVFKGQTISSLVDVIATEAQTSGLSGLVCSVDELQGLRARYPQAFLLAPGVRLAGQAAQDQKRVATPQEAMRLGASAVVAARAICQAKDPVHAFELHLDAVKEVQS